MIDLHCHILPGIDDGARTLAEGVAMCRAAAEAGCEALVATPHQRRGQWWNCDRPELQRRCTELQEAVGPAPRILPGGEIHVDPLLLQELLDLRDDSVEGPQPLAGSRYVLIEFGGACTPSSASELIHELSVAGWRPVIAHPEHFPWLAESPATLADLIALGALAQVTAMSVTGGFGSRTQTETLRLVERGLVHFVASDAHNLDRRPPGLQAAWKTIAARWGEEVARELMVDNPRAVIAEPAAPARTPSRPAAWRAAR
jgi:protein-tyrosine phosphatase